MLVDHEVVLGELPCGRLELRGRGPGFLREHLRVLVELPSNQLYAVCRSFIEMLNMLSIFANAQTDKHSDDIVEEMRRALISYLANYLDRFRPARRRPPRESHSRPILDAPIGRLFQHLAEPDE